MPKLFEDEGPKDRFGELISKTDQERYKDFKKPYVPKEEYKVQEWESSNELKNLGSIIQRYKIKGVSNYVNIELGKGTQYGRAKDMYKAMNDIYSQSHPDIKLTYSEARTKSILRLNKQQIEHLQFKILKGKKSEFIAVPLKVKLVSEKFIETEELGIIFFKNPPVKISETIKKVYLVESFGSILSLAY